MNDTIQNLLDTWERRPRRQLEYNGLSAESQTDLEWTNDLLRAFIPAAREIAEKFGLTPQPPIVIQMPPPLPPESSALASGESLIDENGPQLEQDDKTPPEGSQVAKNGILEEPPKLPSGYTCNHLINGSIGLPILSDRLLEPGNDAPSKPAETTQAAAPSSGTLKTPSKKGRTGAKKRRKRGTARKSASSGAKPAVSPEAPVQPPAPPVPVSEPKPGADLTDPPAPILTSID